MDNFDKILDFASGELPESDEQEFISALGSDDTLRNELRKTLAIKAASREAGIHFSPPMESTRAIFAAIGAEFPETETQANLAQKQALRRNGISKYRFFGSIILNILITTVVVFSILYFSGNDLFDFNKQAVELIDFASSANATNQKNIPVTINRDDSENFMANTKINRIKTDVVLNNKKYINSMYKENNVIEEFTNKSSEIVYHDKNINHLPINYIMPNELKNIKFNTNNLLENNKFEVEANEEESYFEFPFDLLIDIKGANYLFIPKKPNEIENIPFYNNLSIAFLIRVFGGFYIGGDIRSESFERRESYDTDIYNPVEYTFLHNSTAYSFIMRFGSTVPEVINPYGTISLGSNGNGVILRVQSSLEYFLNENYSISAGIEYSSLFYTFHDRASSSQKIGLVYGINYRF